MRVGTVLSACNNNKKYFQWIPHFISAWRKLFPFVNIIIIFIGNEIPLNLRNFKEIILFNEIPNITSSFISQYIRILYPSIIDSDQGVLITDIDMIPLNNQYFTNNIKDISNDKFVYLRNVCMENKQIAICYNIAVPSVWREINKCRTINDIINHLKSVYKKDWFLDQKMLYKYVMNWDKSRFTALNDNNTGFNRLHNIENLDKKIKNEIKRGVYSDYHFSRPFKKYKNINTEVINHLCHDKDFLFITGASSNHFKTLIQFLLSFKQNNSANYPILVYDLGLKEEEVNELKKEWNVKKFNYEKYPSWVSIQTYAWKPIIIKEVSETYNYKKIMWLDAGCKFIEKVDKLINVLENVPIYSPKSLYRIRRLTHRKTIKLMQARELIMNTNRSGGICAFDLSKPWVKEIIGDWYKWALVKNCIIPEGSSRQNHRQDQSILSILFWRYHNIHKFPIIDRFIGFTAWNDID